MNSFQALQLTLKEELKQYHLPMYLDPAVECFRHVHRFYRSFKQIQVFEKHKSENGHPAIYGAALLLVGEYTTIGSYATKIALITKCAEDLLQCYRHLSDRYCAFLDAIEWRYPIYHSIAWKIYDSSHPFILPSSFTLFIKIYVTRFLSQIRKIVKCSLRVLWELFKLSMCLEDAFLLLQGDPKTKYESYTELIGNWEEYQHQLRQDQKLLIEKIRKSGRLADSILRKMHAEVLSDGIIKAFEELNHKTEVLQKTTKNLFREIYEVGKETLKLGFTSGKLTPFHLDLGKGQETSFIFEPQRYPPWGGATHAD